MAPTAPGAVPVGPGDTGTCPGPGRTSELLGFGCGVTVTVGGGSCAAAPPTDNSRTVRPQQTRRIMLMKSIPNTASLLSVNISAWPAFPDYHQMKLIRVWTSHRRCGLFRKFVRCVAQTVAEVLSAGTSADAVRSRRCHSSRLRFSPHGRWSGVDRSEVNVIARRGALTLSHARQEHLPAMQRLAPGAGMVRAPQRALRAPQLVVRRLWPWLRDGGFLSGTTANRGLACRRETPQKRARNATHF